MDTDAEVSIGLETLSAQTGTSSVKFDLSNYNEFIAEQNRRMQRIVEAIAAARLKWSERPRTNRVQWGAWVLEDGQLVLKLRHSQGQIFSPYRVPIERIHFHIADNAVDSVFDWARQLDGKGYTNESMVLDFIEAAAEVKLGKCF